MALSDAPSFADYQAAVAAHDTARAVTPRDRVAVAAIRKTGTILNRAYLLALRESDETFAAAEIAYADACASGVVADIRVTQIARDAAVAAAILASE